MSSIPRRKNTFSKITKLFKSIISPYIRHTQLPVVHKNVLPAHTVSNIRTRLDAHVARDSNTHSHFDSDAVE